MRDSGDAEAPRDRDAGDAPGDGAEARARAGDEPSPDPAARDGIPEALRGARPESAGMSAALSRARIAAAMFGVSDIVRIGRYEVESRAGAGGGGEVFVARDPELSRRVALKLMRGGGDRERLLAEGQALARLSHPNIVPVYDAGTLGDEVYVVMELVEGDTLRAYCADPARSVRDIVRAYRQAAEGLAAAHRAGFIHRDFKPDNVLVGRDGRVRVVDFGLARSSAATGGERGGEAVSPVSVTRAGLGTPRYMAPEQATLEVLTPAADQYAFCASLREGVLARARGMPRWLDAIVRRGMATAPAARYPSMTAVHAALGRDPAWRWRRRGAVAGVLGLALAAFVLGRGDRAAGPSCDTGAAELMAIWGPAAAAQTDAQLAALSTPYAPDARAQIMSMLDKYAAAWRTGHRNACVAHRDGTQSAEMFDRRGGCLSRAKAAFATGVAVAGAARAEQLAKVIDALAGLPDLDRCADYDALTTAVAPPPPPIAPEVAVVADQLAALEVEVRAARPDVRPRIAGLVARARSLGYAPLLARALRLDGVAAIDVGLRTAAVAPLDEATTLALTAHDDALAVEAYARRMFAACTSAPACSDAGIRLMAAIAARLPPSDALSRVLLDNSIGILANTVGQRDAARAAFERALDTARTLKGPARLEAAPVWTNLGIVTDSLEQRCALAKERLEIVEDGLAPTHPLVLAARITTAHLTTHRDRARAALEVPCTQLGELHPEHGSEILECEYQLGWLAIERGDRAAARAAFARAVATERFGGDGEKLALSRAYRAFLEGRPDNATKALDAAFPSRRPPKDAEFWQVLNLADQELTRGMIAQEEGRTQDARAAFDAARTYYEDALRTRRIPRSERRLAYARASLVWTWPKGELPAEARRHAADALAWYRSAGGYDDVVAALAPLVAR